MIFCILKNNENQFETELSWCIRQLELGICNKTGETRQGNI